LGFVAADFVIFSSNCIVNSEKVLSRDWRLEIRDWGSFEQKSFFFLLLLCGPLIISGQPILGEMVVRK
jgi:hypothetical protein